MYKQHASGGKQRDWGMTPGVCGVHDVWSRERMFLEERPQQVMHRVLAASGDAPVSPLYQKASAVHRHQTYIAWLYVCIQPQRDM